MARIITIFADQLTAGDDLVIREDGIKRSFHVCELQFLGRVVKVTYNGDSGFEHVTYDADDKVRVIE